MEAYNAGMKKTWVLMAAFLLATFAAKAGTLTQTIAASNLPKDSAASAADVIDANAVDPTAPCDVLVAVQVPHNQQPIDKLVAYPYPVRPPANNKPVPPLFDDDKMIKQMVLNQCYTTRRHDLAYPAYGWRFENALKAAIIKSGMGMPHHIASAYPWTKKMMQWIKPEIDRINLEEEQRLERYEKMCSHWETDGVEIENEATRKGLQPVAVRTVRALAKVRLEPGTWYIAGTRKVPGLLYYWQQPVTVVAGQTPTVKLTQENALFIQGAW